MADDLQQTGLEFIAENVDDYIKSIKDAADSLVNFEGVGEAASKAFDAFGEIVTGALRRVGEVAVDALGQAANAAKDFFVDSVSEALDAEKNIAKLNATIKSTGGEAGVTTEYAQKLAMQFRDLAGGSDDAVLAIEQLGLQAGTISKEEMPDFIQKTLDLAQVTGSTESAALLLARSEDDVLGAMSRARRMGILFSQSLQEQIKQLVKDGKTKEANELFTKRLAEATKGLAQAAGSTISGQWEILQGNFKEIQETVGTALLPLFQILFDQVLEPAIPMLESFGQSLANVISLLISGDFKGGIFGQMEDSDFISFLFDARDAVINLFKSFELFPNDIVGAIANFFYSIGQDNLGDGLLTITGYIQDLWNWINGSLLPTLYNLSNWFQNVILPILEPVIRSFQMLWLALSTGNATAFFYMLGQVGQAIIDAFSNLWIVIFPELQKLWNNLIAWIQGVLPILQAEWSKWSEAAWAWISGDIWPRVLANLYLLYNSVKSWVEMQVAPLRSTFSGWTSATYDWAVDLWNKQIKPQMDTLIKGLTGWITEQQSVIQTKIQDEWIPAFKLYKTDTEPSLIFGLGDAIGRASKWVVEVGLPSLVDAITNGLRSSGGKMALGLLVAFYEQFQLQWYLFQYKVQLLFSGILSGFSGVNWQPIIQSLMNLRETINWLLQSIGWDIVQGIAEGIRNGSFSIYGALWSVINDAINNIRRIFSISSPSKVTANIIGEPIGQGIAQGILSSIGDIQSAMTMATMGNARMVSPVMSMGGGVSNVSNSRTYAPSLNVNTTQSSQGVIADFAIMNTMAA